MGAPRHSEETKQAALGHLATHGSIRKAAKAAGVPPSTVHRWIQGLSPKAIHALVQQDVPEQVEDAGQDADLPQNLQLPLPKPTDVVTQGPSDTGLPRPLPTSTLQRQNQEEATDTENAQGVALQADTGAEYGADAASAKAALPTEPGASTAAPMGSQDVVDDEGIRWVADLQDPLMLHAFRRYVSALANGAHPLNALTVGQAVHPGFDLTDAQQLAIRAGVAQLTFAELGALRVELADPPQYVRSLVDSASMSPELQGELRDELEQAMQDGYEAAINDCLIQLGLDPIGGVTDPGVLSDLQQMATSRADGIANTWNSDAASRVGQAWLDSQGVQAPEGEYPDNPRGWAGATADMRDQQMQGDLQDWVEQRSVSKSDTWASDAVQQGYALGMADFARSNPDVADTFHVEGDDPAACQECQDMMDAGSMPIQQMDSIHLPAHPNCEHVPVPDVSEQASSPVDLWTGQAETPGDLAMSEQILRGRRRRAIEAAERKGCGCEDTIELAYDESQHPRDDHGRWTAGGGGDTPSSAEKLGKEVAKAGPSVLRTSNVVEAAKALAAGQRVELSQPREVATLLNELNRIAKEAQAKGERAPLYDLCKVSVAGTNLFCAESLGVPRVDMPQLSGKPTPGSPADALPKNDKGEVDIGPAFKDYLMSKGFGVVNDTEYPAYLRASQNELNGVKVAGMMNNPNMDRTVPIFVSADNYIIDGHHRWAANVGLEIQGEHDPMPVMRVNAKITDLLPAAAWFASQMGIPPASVGAGVRAAEEARDDAGRWTDSGGHDDWDGRDVAAKVRLGRERTKGEERARIQDLRDHLASPAKEGGHGVDSHQYVDHRIQSLHQEAHGHPAPLVLRQARSYLAEGVTMAGLVVLAQDTGRVLLIQRSVKDTADPAAGKWEFPGGHIAIGLETAFQAAMREWAEEVGRPVPMGRVTGSWTSRNGVYQGFVWQIDQEAEVPINLDFRRVLNPDDPDGDDIEVAAWWDPTHLPGMPALRAEMSSTDWSLLRVQGRVDLGYPLVSPLDDASLHEILPMVPLKGVRMIVGLSENEPIDARNPMHEDEFWTVFAVERQRLGEVDHQVLAAAVAQRAREQGYDAIDITTGGVREVVLLP